MNTEVNHPGAVHILKEFGPRDWGFKKGDVAYTQIIYLQKFHTFLGLWRKKKRQEMRDYWGNVLILGKIFKSIMVLYFVRWAIIPVDTLTLHKNATLISLKKPVFVTVLIKIAIMRGLIHCHFELMLPGTEICYLLKL